MIVHFHVKDFLHFINTAKSSTARARQSSKVYKYHYKHLKLQNCGFLPLKRLYKLPFLHFFFVLHQSVILLHSLLGFTREDNEEEVFYGMH